MYSTCALVFVLNPCRRKCVAMWSLLKTRERPRGSDGGRTSENSKGGREISKRIDRFNRDKREVFVSSRLRPRVCVGAVGSLVDAGKAGNGGRKGEVPLAQLSAKERSCCCVQQIVNKQLSLIPGQKNGTSQRAAHRWGPRRVYLGMYSVSARELQLVPETCRSNFEESRIQRRGTSTTQIEFWSPDWSSWQRVWESYNGKTTGISPPCGCTWQVPASLEERLSWFPVGVFGCQTGHVGSRNTGPRFVYCPQP